MHRFADAPDRFALWEAVLAERRPSTVAEVGVFRGRFAARALAATDAIERYYMIDPWRHLGDWNKPANRDDEQFARFFDETMAATEAHAEKRIVLRGTTTEVIDEIPDGSLDLAYVDGDHTLRGITIDLLRVWPKMRPGGLLCGDDLTPTIWQHDVAFEPTFVFPYAAYFAEAVDAPFYALPHDQFAIEVESGFRYVDVGGRHPDRTVHAAMAGRPTRLTKAADEIARLSRRASRRLARSVRVGRRR